MKLAGIRIRHAVPAVAVLAAGLAAFAALQQAPGGPADAPAPTLASAAVRATGGADATSHDGVVQAVRQTVLAAQVAGAVVAIEVKAGDRVKSGQLLLRLDARAAEQTAAASAAQVQAARAAQDAATREFERQRQLFQMQYISAAALDRAEAQHKSAMAEAAAQLAAAGAARTQSGFYLVHAPYDGIVSEVPVVLGDMAMPGRPLLTLYDPAALRVSAAVPPSVAARLDAQRPPLVELAGAAGRIAPVRWQVMPAVDPATHTLELRLELPPGTVAAPGLFARAWLPGGAAAAERLSVPASAVVRRAELNAVYVIGADQRPLLRQVRLGRTEGERIEILAGLAAGERIALDPQAAARMR